MISENYFRSKALCLHWKNNLLSKKQTSFINCCCCWCCCFCCYHCCWCCCCCSVVVIKSNLSFLIYCEILTQMSQFFKNFFWKMKKRKKKNEKLVYLTHTHWPFLSCRWTSKSKTSFSSKLSFDFFKFVVCTLNLNYSMAMNQNKEKKKIFYFELTENMYFSLFMSCIKKLHFLFSTS